MNILVTGANGYLGRELVSWLIKETQNNIYALDKNWDNQAFLLSNRVKKVVLSLDKLATNYVIDDTHKIDLIIHLAAKIMIDPVNPSQAFELMESNCLNLIRLLDWAKGQQITKLVFVSSMTVYSPLIKYRSYNEEQYKSPSSFYGLSKLFGEQIIEMYSQQTKLRAIVLRLPGLFGSGRKSGLIYNLAKQIKNRRAVRINLKGLHQWETIHVSDAAKIIGEIARKKKFERLFSVFNVGYGDSKLKIRAIIKLIQEHYKSFSKALISNEKDYLPFIMNTSKIRRYLPNISLDFRQSLFRYLEEMH